jgi:tRNA(His) 5'-end guanylyltransferase
MANVPKKDSLGDRMKQNYEDRTRFSLPRRTYTIMRVDGRAFHTWTKGLDKPYDKDFMDCMDAAAIRLCQEVSGTQFAFVQSDEISLLATDFEDEATQSWFDGNIQKWVSVGASIAATAFNQVVANRAAPGWVEPVDPWSKKQPNATFDARVFTIPDYVEVENYFIWRQKDAERNSVTLLAQAYASHKQLQGKSTAERHEIIHAAGDNWAKHPIRFKHGAVIRYKDETEANNLPENFHLPERPSRWFMDEKTPVFTRDRAYLTGLIPRHWSS